jgi:hypothetical protein
MAERHIGSALVTKHGKLVGMFTSTDACRALVQVLREVQEEFGYLPPPAAVRVLLKETKTGAVAGKVDRVANDLNTTSEQLVASLVALGLKVPDRAREKPVFVPHGEEIVWFNRNGRGELWINAKASKFADGKDEDGEDEAEEGEDKPRRSRSRKKDGE